MLQAPVYRIGLWAKMRARKFQIVENGNVLWGKNMGASQYVEPQRQAPFAGALKVIQLGT